MEFAADGSSCKPYNGADVCNHSTEPKPYNSPTVFDNQLNVKHVRSITSTGKKSGSGDKHCNRAVKPCNKSANKDAVHKVPFPRSNSKKIQLEKSRKLRKNPMEKLEKAQVDRFWQSRILRQMRIKMNQSASRYSVQSQPSRCTLNDQSAVVWRRAESYNRGCSNRSTITAISELENTTSIDYDSTET